MAPDEQPQQPQLQQIDVAVILARMEVKLDHALEKTNDHEARIRRLEDNDPPEIGDHETRIRALERKVWVASGVFAFVGTGVGTALSRVIGT